MILRLFAAGWLALGCLTSALAADLQITAIVREEDGSIRVTHTANTDSYYRLLRGDRLTTIAAVSDLVLGTTEQGVLHERVHTADTSFFRVEAIPRDTPLDSDGDGIDDIYELARNTLLNPLDASDATRPDPDGHGLTFLQVYQSLAAAPTQIAESWPHQGEAGVAVTRETVVQFSGPLGAGTLLTGANFHAVFGGRQILARTELSADRTRATLFYLENLPAGARVRVSLDGESIVDARGRRLDGDGDGVPGGMAQIDFETFGSTPVGETAVVGRVLASEQIADGNGGFADKPLAGVIITVDGAEESLRAITGADGTFKLQPAPVGRFFVHVDGRYAVGSTWPDGAYYPFIGKAWEAEAGKTDNRPTPSGNIYLPLVAAGSLQSVSSTAETTITFPASVVEKNPALAGVEVRVPANSLYDDNGTRGGRVGIAPVPPDRLPEPLPEGLKLPLVITVQTDGARNFSQPVPVRFPNLPDPVSGRVKAPGESSVLWSFSHDTGRWEPVAPMTVSDDGRFVETDAGFGVVQPGWHGEDPTSQVKKFPCPDLTWTEGLSLIKALTDCADSLLGVFKLLNQAVQTISLLTDTVNLGSDAANALSKGDYTPATIRDLVQKLTNAKRSALELADTLNDVASPLSRALKIAKCVLAISKSLLDGLCNRADCLGSVVKWMCGYAQPIVNMANQFIGVIENAQKGLTHGLVASFCAAIESSLESANLVSKIQGNRSVAPSGLGRQISAEEQAAVQQLILNLHGMVEAGQFLAPAKADLEAAIASGQTVSRQVVLFDKVARASAKLSANAAFQITIKPPADKPGPTVVQTGSLSELVGRDWSARMGSSYELKAFYPSFGIVARASGGFPDLRALRGLPPERLEQERRKLIEVIYGGFDQALGQDKDGDGVPDFVEAQLGTDPNRRDTDRDGLSDLEEMIAGSDPLAPAGGSAGMLAATSLPGVAQHVCAMGDRAYVALGDAGLAVLSLPAVGNPIVLAQLKLPGQARRVACEGNLVAVTLGGAGLALVDVSDPPAARIVHQVLLDGAALSVATVDGVAYVGTDAGRIQAVHLASGAVLSSISVGAAVQDLGLERDILFSVTAQGVQSFQINEELEPLGTLSLPGFAEGLGGLRRISLGGGLAYVTIYEGFASIDVSDPTAMRVVGPVMPHGPNSFKQIVPTGSGLGIAAVGTNPRDDGSHDVFLYDLSDPAVTSSFSTVYRTPGIAYSVALHEGRVLVADGASGIEVLNPVARDIGENSPSIALQATFSLNPALAEEGRLVALTADARDDVMVRQVEFYLDGVLAQVDAAYPFEFRFHVPSLSSGTNQFTLRARAVDTAGNETWSELLSVKIAPDLTPPKVRPAPPTSAGFGANLLSVGAVFSEPVDEATLDPTTFYLIGAGPDRQFGTVDDLPVVAAIVYAKDDRLAELRFADVLPPGKYQARIRARVADLAGNILGADVFWNFEAVFGADQDGDGLTDEFELANGMNPLKADENGNGIPDALEDFDGDGLSNGVEMLLGTNPRNRTTFNGVPDNQLDRDGDFLSDVLELKYGTDRLNPDTDGDGWNDEIEVSSGSNPLVPNAYLPGVFVSSNVAHVLGLEGTQFRSAQGDVLRLGDGQVVQSSATANVLRQGGPNKNGYTVNSARPSVRIRVFDVEAPDLSPNELPTTGAFVVEAEDYDFGAGQHVAAADLMPYLGGAYKGLAAVLGVDYFNTDANDFDVYRPDTAPNNVNLLLNLAGRYGIERPGWSATTNLRIGWYAFGDWQQYTRNLPPGRYWIWAALSHSGRSDGQLSGSLDLVTGDVTKPNPTLTQLGSFNAPGTGAFGNNSLVLLRDATDAPYVFEVGAQPTTFRFNLGSGDFDWFVLIPTNSAPQ